MRLGSRVRASFGAAWLLRAPLNGRTRAGSLRFPFAPESPMAAKKKPVSPPKKSPAKASARSTVSGSRRGTAAAGAEDLAARKMAATQATVEALRFNENKPGEYGEAARTPDEGQHVKPADITVTGSTLSEVASSAKVGRGEPQDLAGANPTVLPLDRVRVDSGGQGLTTNFGAPVADNQHSLKAGLRGPALLEDFILREKITHFDHERIPERIVHARGSGAHGFFECYEPQARLTRASFLAEKGKRTPVFVRFSTVAGERGSFDLARDVRGFATKFYTDEGNFDIVGNNIPVFFIQDAMKFPDLVHAVKPEPHHAMPQAASAHDTFWDFVSLMPESTHMLMWVMSDRAIPRSYRMMQGFGVHTFRLVNAKGESRFVKFHWNPVQGTHSVDWDEAVKINGADPDFHRRDLWEAIEAGAFPEWELGLQVFTEEQANQFSFDVLDATKIIPEELVPVKPVGRMVLNRNPDNFFAETEQVAFGVQNVVPGIDFSNDPLLAGRIHSYFDTQLLRLGGPNFHEIPINSPVAPVHNNQRDGFHRQAIHRGRVSYEPNSLAGGCPFQHGSARGFMSFPDPTPEDKVRGKPEKFAEHYNQARLFFNSQSEVEKAHIVRAFRFELTKVQVPAIRERMVANLANVHPDLASLVAAGLGIEVPEPAPLAIEPVEPEVDASPALSLFARPGDGRITTRKVAILVAAGVDGEGAMAVHQALTEAGAVPRLVAARLGGVETVQGEALDPDATFETMPSCLFDAVVVPDGELAAQALGELGHALEFVKDQYRHCKAIMALGAGRMLLEKAMLPLDRDDEALVVAAPGKAGAATRSFVAAIAAHRNWERASDPPPI
jgi:catalase